MVCLIGDRLKAQEAAQVLAAHTLTQIIDDKLTLHLQLIQDSISGSQRSTIFPPPSVPVDGSMGGKQGEAGEPFHLKNLSPQSPAAAQIPAPQLLNPRIVKPRLEEPSVSQQVGSIRGDQMALPC